uniref:VldT n=1 Tax=Streptomyces hygroscopicus subsp. limoneus TaxID=264445 RepID=Q15JH0_STRHL|nr:VldT [Streptomyces hygroscopicus subsp. limoneus]
MTGACRCLEAFGALPSPWKCVSMGSLRGLDGGLAPAVFDFDQTADDRWVIPIACYRRPSDELLSLLGAAHTQEHIRSAIASWISWGLEEAAAEQGTPLAVVRSREEFLAHPQSQAIQTEPLVTAPVLSVSPWVTRLVKAQPPSGFW